jgi:ABC-type transport system involved in multi-copper enzyme maturation permease subunit
VIDQSRAEMLKIRSTRTTFGLFIGMIAIVLLFVLLTAFLSSASQLTTKEQQRDLFSIGSFAGVFSALAAILLVTGEYRFGTITPTFLFNPRRPQVVAAKVAASLVAGLVFASVGEALSVGVGAAILNGRGISLVLGSHAYELLTLGTLVGNALWGGIGVGVGMIIRNQVGAIIGLLAWGFVIENLLFAFVPSVGRLTPGQAQNGFMGLTTEHLLGPAAGGAVLLAWTVVLCVGGVALAARRDVS